MRWLPWWLVILRFATMPIALIGYVLAALILDPLSAGYAGWQQTVRAAAARREREIERDNEAG